MKIRLLSLFLALVYMALQPQPALAQSETVLHSFDENGVDGAFPYGSVAVDGKGNVYGTTYNGGAGGFGTVWKVTPAGVETILYSFVANGDGAYPATGVARDKAGNLYGTTSDGTEGYGNYGTVWKLTSSGTKTTLHRFKADGIDGYYPVSSVVLDKAGNLYGTTHEGGATNHGTVYKITPSGTETVLYNFAGTPDGCYPYGSNLAIGKKNALYGTTLSCGDNGYGTVFKVTQSGAETVLHSFNWTDGVNPDTGVILDKLGNVYGVTENGGMTGYGVVYEIEPSGTETILRNFANDGTDGYHPSNDPAIDKLGNLYGATMFGGLSGAGIAFKLSPSGAETILHNFANDGTDGYNPSTGHVVLGKKDVLYGTTPYGGTYGVGTVWKIVP